MPAGKKLPWWPAVASLGTAGWSQARCPNEYEYGDYYGADYGADYYGAAYEDGADYGATTYE